MKSKLRLLVVSCFIAGVAISGIKMAQNNHIISISLENLMGMAKAECEAADKGCCKNWQDCINDDSVTVPDSLLCDGGGGC